MKPEEIKLINPDTVLICIRKYNYITKRHRLLRAFPVFNYSKGQTKVFRDIIGFKAKYWDFLIKSD